MPPSVGGLGMGLGAYVEPVRARARGQKANMTVVSRGAGPRSVKPGCSARQQTCLAGTATPLATATAPVSSITAEARTDGDR